MKIIYLAAPLFSLAERNFNAELSYAIQAGYDDQIGFIMPQKFDGNPPALYTQCIENIKIADIVLALIDGTEADAGVAFEVGIAKMTGKKIIGLRTDFRKSGDMPGNSYANLMIGYSMSVLIVAVDRNKSIKDVATMVREAIMPGISTFGELGD